MNPLHVFWIAGLVWIAAFWVWTPTHPDKSDKLRMAGLWMMGLSIVPIMTWPIYAEAAAGYAVVKFDADGKISEVSTSSLWCVSNCSNVPKNIALTSQVRSITQNPKVRQIKYNLETEIFDYELFFRRLGVKSLKEDPGALDEVPALAVNKQKLSEAVEFQLYEFNNAHSRELSEIYNPLDPKQREKLEQLLKDHIDPALAQEGIRVARLITFSVE